MGYDESKSNFLIQIGSNIHYENEKKVLELNTAVLKDYYDVDEIVLR